MRLLTARQQRAGMHRAASAQRMAPPATKMLPAPFGGLNGRDAWSDMDERDAIRMVNLFPEFGKVRVRRGSLEFATVGVDSGGFVQETEPVETLAELQTAGSTKLVAAAGDAVWDITAGGETDTRLGFGFTTARWQTAQMNGVLGLVNGEDAPKTYDGTTWADMTVSGLTVTTLIGVNVFKSRSYFIPVNSQSFWYSAVNTLGGALTEFPLGAVGTFGGYLSQMVTWTRDGGAGVDDLAVFLMSSGDVMVYAGSNPGDADDWALVGVFSIGAPLGRRAAIKAGGDVLVLTVDGPVLLSKVLPGGRGAESFKLTDKLGAIIPDQTKLTGDDFGWQFQHYPRGQFALINYPTSGAFEQYVVNLRSGAWGGPWRGMNASCWCVFDEDLYFGAPGGTVMQADTGPSDNGASIVFEALQAFSYLGAMGTNKQVYMAGPLLECATAVELTLGLCADFMPDPQTSVTVTLGNASGGAVWDVAEWDAAEWAGDNVAVQGWFAHQARGYAIAPELRGSQRAEFVAWNATRLAYRKAGVI